MRGSDILQYLCDENKAVTLEKLKHLLQLSENSIRSEIQHLNADGRKHGFNIRYIKNEGYYLTIKDQKLFNAYVYQLSNEVDYYQQSQRIKLLIYFLLQFSVYVSIDELCELTTLSRSTVLKDLDEVEKTLKHYHLHLKRMRKHGILIEGEERQVRRAISDFVIGSDYYLKPTEELQKFRNQFDESQLYDKIKEIMKKYDIKVSALALENLVTHFYVTLYRIVHGNYILNRIETYIDEKYLMVVELLDALAFELVKVHLPENEKKYFALDIQSKSTISEAPVQDITKVETIIINILKKMDDEFGTDFSDDKQLKENLILHVFPLLNRVNYNLQLDNPLLNDINQRFMNVSMVALRFAELLEKQSGYGKLSPDEIGFIMLHFAAYFERRQIKMLKAIRKVVVICETGNSSAQLIKLKAESVFTNASVSTVSQSDLSRYDQDLPDIFLSTIPLNDTYHDIPIIHITDFLSDHEIERIRSLVSLNVYKKKAVDVSDTILSLFKPQYFQILQRGDYMDIICRQAKKMMEDGIATDEFCDLVVQRENRYPTIFMNGVACPHPARLIANENTVGVSILPKPIWYKNKSVSFIFLINIKQESIDLHQETSRLLLRIIEDDSLRKRLLSSQNFDEFIYEIKKIWR